MWTDRSKDEFLQICSWHVRPEPGNISEMMKNWLNNFIDLGFKEQSLDKKWLLGFWLRV